MLGFAQQTFCTFVFNVKRSNSTIDWLRREWEDLFPKIF